MELARKIIAIEEGWRNQPYYCSEGYATVGYGFKLSNTKWGDLPSFVLPLSAGNAWLDSEIELINNKLIGHNWYENLDDVRRAIIISMAYQMGIGGLFEFKGMIKSLYDKDYQEAAGHMLDSLWARQTPARADRHANQMRTGIIHNYYLP